MSSVSAFHQEGYAVFRGVLSRQTLDLVSAEYQILIANNRLRLGDPQVERGYAGYGLNVTEALMQYLLPFMEEQTGFKLYPTYSYGRVYLKGAKLDRHIDRPSCEISLSMMIAQTGGKPWPLYCESLTGQTVAIELEPGDMMIYRGLDVPHWRDPFEGETQTQVFLHYVRQDGPYADYKFDMRPRLGAAPVKETLGQTRTDAAQPQPFAIFRDGRTP